MAGNKYIANVSGQLKEVAGTQTSTGTAEANKLVALDANGKLDASLLPTGVGDDIALVQASEALAAGDYVNIHNVSGSARVRKADATTAGKEAHGFVLEGVSSGAQATVYFEGQNNQVSGATPGVVFLSTTPGQGTATPPSSAGNIVQRIGFAVSSSAVNFEAFQSIELA